MHVGPSCCQCWPTSNSGPHSPSIGRICQFFVCGCIVDGEREGTLTLSMYTSSLIRVVASKDCLVRCG